jgi:NADH-quinone oxidoreductase subunit N
MNLSWIVQNRQSMAAFLPEIVLTVASLFALMLGAYRPASRKLVVFLGAASLIAYGVLSLPLATLSESPILFSGAIKADPFFLFFKLLFVAVGCITLFFILRSDEFTEVPLAEVIAFLLALTLSLSMMAASNDILMMYLSLEMVSVMSYILVGYKKHSRRSSEAGLKYVLYGSFASGVMIYGLSCLYGLTGSTDLHEIGKYFAGLTGISTAPVVLFSLLCIMMGLGFKIATFPTQMWCPDVYEGASLPVTAFLSVGPKAAGFAMTIRFFVTTFGVRDGQGVEIFQFINWQLVLAILAAATMSIGNLAACSQKNLKRLLAYSSIAHAGYLLMAFSALSTEGVQAILFYLVTYLLMNFGAFFIVLLVANQLGTEEIDGYRGLGWRAPFLGVALTIFLFSLTGLPPFAGFIGKVFLFGAVVKQGNYWLAAIAAVNTVISLFYYARIIKAMYLQNPLDESAVTVPVVSRFAVAVLVVPTIILGIFWEPLSRLVDWSVAGFFG